MVMSSSFSFLKAVLIILFKPFSIQIKKLKTNFVLITFYGYFEDRLRDSKLHLNIHVIYRVLVCILNIYVATYVSRTLLHWSSEPLNFSSLSDLTLLDLYTIYICLYLIVCNISSYNINYIKISSWLHFYYTHTRTIFFKLKAITVCGKLSASSSFRALCGRDFLTIFYNMDLLKHMQ